MKYGEMFLCRHPGDSEQFGRGLMRPVRTSVRNILIHGSGLESDRLWSGSTASSQSNLADQIRPAEQLRSTLWRNMMMENMRKCSRSKETQVTDYKVMEEKGQTQGTNKT